MAVKMRLAVLFRQTRGLRPAGHRRPAILLGSHTADRLSHPQQRPIPESEISQ